MTPLQKSIAEIEAEIVNNLKQGKADEVAGLGVALQIIVANLEYERGVIKDSWTDGRCGLSQNFNDYYTKTYNNERKD